MWAGSVNTMDTTAVVRLWSMAKVKDFADIIETNNQLTLVNREIILCSELYKKDSKQERTPGSLSRLSVLLLI